jgi:hypothetical protein
MECKNPHLIVAVGPGTYQKVVKALDERAKTGGTQPFPIKFVTIGEVYFQKGGIKHEVDGRYVLLDDTGAYAQFYTTSTCNCLHVEGTTKYTTEEIQEAFKKLLQA